MTARPDSLGRRAGRCGRDWRLGWHCSSRARQPLAEGAATTVLPGSGISVVVLGYANGGLASVAVLDPDLAALWGRPPVPSATPATSAAP